MSLIAIAGLLLGFGPATKGEVVFVPNAAEAQVPEGFRMAEGRFAFEIEPIHRARGFSVSALRFPSPVTTVDVENNTVHAEYFQPDGPGKRPAVVVLHILGADFALARYLAARLAEKGVASLFVKLPYYGERRPAAADGKRFLSVDAERSLVSMRQGVLDVRRAAAWLASRPEVDPEKLGVTGISLGGIVSSLAAAIDPKINRGAFLLAGGDLGEILWSMPEAAKYRAAWIAMGRTKDDLKALTRPVDPLTYAHRLQGKRLMMVDGNIDEVIPPSSAIALWKAAGKPPITWLDCGHYSSAAFFLPVVRKAVDFFAEEVPR